MRTDLSGVYARDITDTSGALYILEQRLGKKFSPDTLHYHVREGKLRAYVFVNGELVRWQTGEKRRGQTLIFLKKDIYNFNLPEKKRGRGASKQFSDVAEIAP